LSKLQYYTVNGTFIRKLICVYRRSLERSIANWRKVSKKVEGKVETLQVSFMNIGNVTVVSVVVENSQIQKAVDLQRRMSCEMQLNVVVNVHVAVHSSTFQRNKIVSCYQNTLFVYCIQLIYIHKRTHMAVSSVQHTVQSQFTFQKFLPTHFTLNWTLCEYHIRNSNVSVQNLKSCLTCAQLRNLPFEIRFKVSF